MSFPILEVLAFAPKLPNHTVNVDHFPGASIDRLPPSQTLGALPCEELVATRLACRHVFWLLCRRRDPLRANSLEDCSESSESLQRA